jgi:hypothetical protein
MIFLLQQLHGGIVKQPHPFVGLGSGSKQHAKRTKKAERVEDEGRAQDTKTAKRVKFHLHMGSSELHGIVPLAIKSIQGAEGVQISNLKFQTYNAEHKVRFQRS